MTNPAPSPFAFVRTFNPVFTRNRHDGWKPQKQIAFINALAESGCVADACRRVGMSTESAYALKRRYDAIDFRLTWDAALDYAVKRLSDAALSRAIHGVSVPHYYKGEVVGEHRRFNETLTMFILRYRDPVTYAKSWDRRDIVKGHSEQEAEQLAVGIDSILTDNSRRYCEANAAKEQAEAYAEDDGRISNERREIAYQAHIKADDAAKAAAADAARADEARIAGEVRAARARAAAAQAETGEYDEDAMAARLAEAVEEGRRVCDAATFGPDVDQLVAETMAAYYAAIGSLLSSSSGDSVGDAKPRDGTDSFHSGVASGSSTSADDDDDDGAGDAVPDTSGGVFRSGTAPVSSACSAAGSDSAPVDDADTDAAPGTVEITALAPPAGTGPYDEAAPTAAGFRILRPEAPSLGSVRRWAGRIL